MLPITGYVDRWSVRPGEEINFMIGVRGGGRYLARIAGSGRSARTDEGMYLVDEEDDGLG